MPDVIVRPWLSERVAVSGSSAQFPSAMAAGTTYLYFADVDTWLNQDVNPTAIANTAGNQYIPAKTYVLLTASGTRTKVAVIQAVGAGNATLTPASR